MTPDLSFVTTIAAMKGEDAEESELLKAAHREATGYLSSFKWVRGIKESYYGVGGGGVVATFLFRVDPAPQADEWLWVIVGDLPSCYVVTDRAPNGVEALKVYCEIMDAWVHLVRTGGDLKNAFPVAADPTAENATALEKRVRSLRERIIPALSGR